MSYRKCSPPPKKKRKTINKRRKNKEIKLKHKSMKIYLNKTGNLKIMTKIKTSI